MSDVDNQISFLKANADLMLFNLEKSAGTRTPLGDSVLGSFILDGLFLVDHVTAPAVNAPTPLDTGELTAYQGIGDWVTARAKEITDMYFPNLLANLGDLPESWIAGVLKGTTDTGLPAAVEDRLWITARERTTRELLRAEEDAGAVMSSRGFRTPTGVMLTQMRRAREDANKRLNEAANNIATQNAQIKVDLVKLAAQLATDLKPKLIALITETIKAFAALPGIEADTLRARAGAYQAYYGALREYYNIGLDTNRLKVEIGKANSQATLQAVDLSNRHKQVDFDGFIRQTTAASTSYGQAASAALSSMNALVASLASAA